MRIPCCWELRSLKQYCLGITGLFVPIMNCFMYTPHNSHYTVSAFSYYQFYCFQDTEDTFDRFDSDQESLTEFLNSTEALSNRLCVQTEVFRSFISSQLPWFRYQKETWLAIGENSRVTPGLSLCITTGI